MAEDRTNPPGAGDRIVQANFVDSGTWAEPRPTGDRSVRQGMVARFALRMGLRCEEVRRRFEGQVVPRPERWGGFRVQPETFEFWSDRPHRLHERRLFTRTASGWDEGLLYP